MGAAQLRHYLGVGEPFGDVQPFLQATAEFGAGKAQHRLAGAQLVHRNVLGALPHVDHFRKRQHPNTQFVLMAGNQLLGGVGFVAALPELIPAGTGVVAADDEMAASVVLADDGVP